MPVSRSAIRMVELNDRQIALFLALCPLPLYVFDTEHEALLTANEAAHEIHGDGIAALRGGDLLPRQVWQTLTAKKSDCNDAPASDPLVSDDGTPQSFMAIGEFRAARIGFSGRKAVIVLGPCPASAGDSPPLRGVDASTPFIANESRAEARVLLVDDDRNLRDMLSDVLQMHGFSVETAGSVREAMLIVDRACPSVIVSDVGMPDEDGFDLIRQLRALPADRGGDIPAIALTGYARAEDRASALASGYQALLAKPLDLEALIDEIRRLGRT